VVLFSVSPFSPKHLPSIFWTIGWPDMVFPLTSLTNMSAWIKVVSSGTGPTLLHSSNPLDIPWNLLHLTLLTRMDLLRDCIAQSVMPFILCWLELHLNHASGHMPFIIIFDSTMSHHMPHAIHPPTPSALENSLTWACFASLAAMFMFSHLELRDATSYAQTLKQAFFLDIHKPWKT